MFCSLSVQKKKDNKKNKTEKEMKKKLCLVKLFSIIIYKT